MGSCSLRRRALLAAKRIFLEKTLEPPQVTLRRGFGGASVIKLPQCVLLVRRFSFRFY